jgi:hypothetical protein
MGTPPTEEGITAKRPAGDTFQNNILNVTIPEQITVFRGYRQTSAAKPMRRIVAEVSRKPK